MPGLVLLKTRAQHLDRVVEVQKHALHRKLRKIKPGDLILLAEIRPSGPAEVRYAMWLKDQRAAKVGETEGLWGKNWAFIIEGEGCCELNSPFFPEKEKVTSANYGRGGTVAYVAPEDAEVFTKRGLLKPIL